MAEREDTEVIPFRWDIGRREQLGDLDTVEEVETYDGFESDLRKAAVKILARSAQSDLVFVGRSPENLFDYLSGVFEGVDQAPRLTLLHYSNRGTAMTDIMRDTPDHARALLRYFESVELDAASIATRDTQIRFVDVVLSGSTFGALVDMLRYWSDQQPADWNVVERRIGFVGLTIAGKTSPNAYRWWQEEEWVEELRKPRIKNVSVPWRFWSHIGNEADKVTPSHVRARWADRNAMKPRRWGRHLKALRFAAKLYDQAKQRDERAAFLGELNKLPEVQQAWLRSLALRIKGI